MSKRKQAEQAPPATQPIEPNARERRLASQLADELQLPPIDRDLVAAYFASYRVEIMADVARSEKARRV